mmetsp:Transcript_35997/g.81022  ORF Transcript_35997/g.81022 Transcript_35997/m.81022 type:complete len:460 (-) Transcript_35997:206-1585(-)
MESGWHVGIGVMPDAAGANHISSNHAHRAARFGDVGGQLDGVHACLKPPHPVSRPKITEHEFPAGTPPLNTPHSSAMASMASVAHQPGYELGPFKTPPNPHGIPYYYPGGFGHFDAAAAAAALPEGAMQGPGPMGYHMLPNGKRPREAIDGINVPAGAHQDALMELARENLVLKHQLHVASLEVNRLKQVCENYEILQQDKKDGTCKSQSRYWTDEEHQRFLDAIQKFGHKDVKAISQVVGTRSATQVRTHAQKYFMRLARSSKQESTSLDNSNPDQDPSEVTEDQANTSMEAAAAAAAAAGEAGTSAAAAAAFVAATNSKQGGVTSKQRSQSKPHVQIELDGNEEVSIPNHMQVERPFKATRKGPGSPGSMDSSGSVGSSDGTSNGNGSQGKQSSDTTNGNGSARSSNSNGHSNVGSSSDRGDSNNGASSNEGSDPGFFDPAAEDEDNFADELAEQGL